MDCSLDLTLPSQQHPQTELLTGHEYCSEVTASEQAKPLSAQVRASNPAGSAEETFKRSRKCSPVQFSMVQMKWPFGR
ncbi:unnamed protein product [Protopolystoma xenopodis]|uniref:Uncharacterized protein n=1 Tax=Protopolystoma xenopodis TaxID=117903 RepID=A0A448X234_9PLAT|nr:unnamed protein product [Protopolystoma xenopodis]